MMGVEAMLVTGAAMAVGSTTLAAVGAAGAQPVLVGIALGVGCGAMGMVFAGFKGAAKIERKTLSGRPMPAPTKRTESHPPTASV
jgi:hypothetical protein